MASGPCCWTLGQLLYLGLVLNWMFFVQGHPATQAITATATTFVIMGSLFVLAVMSVRAYFALCSGGCPLNQQAFEMAFFGHTQQPCKESFAVVGLFAEPFLCGCTPMWFSDCYACPEHGGVEARLLTVSTPEELS